MPLDLYISYILAFKITFWIFVLSSSDIFQVLPAILLFILCSFAGSPNSLFNFFCKSTLLVHIERIFSLYNTFIVVSVSDLIYKDNYKIDSTGMQVNN